MVIANRNSPTSIGKQGNKSSQQKAFIIIRIKAALVTGIKSPRANPRLTFFFSFSTSSIQLNNSGQFPDPGPWKHPQPRPLDLTSPLGLDALPNQHFTKVKRNTFDLNLMVVGRSINSVFVRLCLANCTENTLGALYDRQSKASVLFVLCKLTCAHQLTGSASSRREWPRKDHLHEHPLQHRPQGGDPPPQPTVNSNSSDPAFVLWYLQLCHLWTLCRINPRDQAGQDTRQHHLR